MTAQIKEERISMAPASQIRRAAASLQRHATVAAVGLVALLFVLPFVAPVHRFPLTGFDSEWIAAVVLALALIAAGLAQRAPLAVNGSMPTIAAILLAVAAVHYLSGLLQYTYAFSALFIFLCAFCAAYLVGRWLLAADLRVRALQGLSIGLLAGGLLSVAVQCLQVFDLQVLPDWAMFSVVDKMSHRRPFANLGQSNQLATYLVFATVASLYLSRRESRKRLLMAAAATLFCGLALTGSRMGSLFGLLVLALLFSRSAISPRTPGDRIQWSAVLVGGYGAGLFLTKLFLVDESGAMATAIERYGEGSLGQRISMWSDALRIIGAHPWLGVGVGEYGGAQYLAAQPHPQLLATNNPHNILLHLAAEFGVPAAVCVFLLVVRWCSLRARVWRTDPHVTTAFILILFVLLHSLLEYPLWHLYFLVAVGLLAGLAEPASPGSAGMRLRAAFVLAPIGVAMLCAAAVMKVDYAAIAAVYDRYLSEVYSGHADAHEPETVAGVIGLISATYFEPQVERLYVELVPAQAQQGDESLRLVGRVLTRLADLRVAVRYIQLLLQAGRIDEALPHVARLKVFAGSSYPVLRAELEASIAGNGPILDPVRRALAEP
jgi:O-antigen ligase